jgi:hypothetical protein
MITRKYLHLVESKLNQFATVGLLGARQIGKTTLAKEIAKGRPSVYLDLENYQDLFKLEDPIPYLESHDGKLIILDEIQRKPDIFKTLRGLIDKRRESGQRYGQFLILGSSSVDLLRQSSESLAGRIVYIEMNPISVIEFSSTRSDVQRLWLCGGFPDSLLANTQQTSMEWRKEFIRTYLERDIPQFNPRIPAETLRRLWTMLAHCQGTPLNAAKMASSLGISGQSVSRYIDLLTDLFLIRRLSPWNSNIGKRLVRSPKTYVRDSGILHALLNIPTLEDLMGHPIVGASWEGFVIDNLLSFLPIGSEHYYYRTARGAEVDLILKLPDGRTIAIEIKKSTVPKIKPGFYEACKFINPTHCYVVYDGEERFSLKNNIIAISLKDLINEII